MEWSLRLATTADAEQLARNVSDGFESYRDFAPADWTPPAAEEERATLDRRLADSDTWCLLAEDGGELAGHVAICSAAAARFSSDEPGLAHFWQLFVKPAWQGSGLAVALHGEAVREAGERGYTSMRLFAVEGAARARRFYERQGWGQAAGPIELPGFDLPVVEYRRPISISV